MKKKTAKKSNKKKSAAKKPVRKTGAPRSKGLGRGLSALVPAAAIPAGPPDIATRVVVEVTANTCMTRIHDRHGRVVLEYVLRREYPGAGAWKGTVPGDLYERLAGVLPAEVTDREAYNALAASLEAVDAPTEVANALDSMNDGSDNDPNDLGTWAPERPDTSASSPAESAE